MYDSDLIHPDLGLQNSFLFMDEFDKSLVINSGKVIARRLAFVLELPRNVFIVISIYVCLYTCLSIAK